MKEKETKT